MPPVLTGRRRSRILEPVGLVHRLSAMILCLGLAAGNAALCAGWAATPEERMACCADGGGCPMHEGKPDDSGADRAITQVEADNCCAASERESSTPSGPAFAASISSAVLGPASVLPPRVPSLVPGDDWRILSPLPTRPVPRHVLLSVFLV